MFDTDVSKARQNVMKWHFEIRKRQERDMTFPPQPSWIMNCSTRSQYHHPPHSKALRAQITQDLSPLNRCITLNGHLCTGVLQATGEGPPSLAAEQDRTVRSKCRVTCTEEKAKSRKGGAGNTIIQKPSESCQKKGLVLVR